MLEDPTKTVDHYYMLLDRGGTIAKKLFAHAKRNRGVEPMPEPTKHLFVLPADGLMTKDWESLIANRELTRREVYPLYYRFKTTRKRENIFLIFSPGQSWKYTPLHRGNV